MILAWASPFNFSMITLLCRTFFPVSSRGNKRFYHTSDSLLQGDRDPHIWMKNMHFLQINIIMIIIEYIICN